MTTKNAFINKWVPNDKFLNNYDEIFRKKTLAELWAEEVSNTAAEMMAEKVPESRPLYDEIYCLGNS